MKETWHALFGLWTTVKSKKVYVRPGWLYLFELCVAGLLSMYKMRGATSTTQTLFADLGTPPEGKVRPPLRIVGGIDCENNHSN